MSIQHIKKILESKKKKVPRFFPQHFGFWPAPKYFILFEYSLRIKMICRMKNDEQNFITKWKCLTFEKFRWHARNFTTARTTTTVPPPTTVSPPINILVHFRSFSAGRQWKSRVLENFFKDLVYTVWMQNIFKTIRAINKNECLSSTVRRLELLGILC